MGPSAKPRLRAGTTGSARGQGWFASHSRTRPTRTLYFPPATRCTVMISSSPTLRAVPNKTQSTSHQRGLRLQTAVVWGVAAAVGHRARLPHRLAKRRLSAPPRGGGRFRDRLPPRGGRSLLLLSREPSEASHKHEKQPAGYKLGSPWFGNRRSYISYIKSCRIRVRNRPSAGQRS